MKAVLISIQPKWVEKIASGQKTIEVRKSRPNLETPFKCYIYCTQGKYKDLFAYGDWVYENRMKVIGEFVCDKITDISVVVRNCNEDYNHVYHNDECKGSCLTWKELQEYGKGKPLYGWHISDLKIYDKPKELSEFKAWRDCETPEKQFKNCTFTYRHPSHCECCQWIKRPPQSWCYVEVKE